MSSQPTSRLVMVVKLGGMDVASGSRDLDPLCLRL